MTLGIALVLIFVIYLIDKYNRWRQAAKIAIGFVLAVVILGVLWFGGAYGWDKYNNWREARKEARQQAESERVEAKKVADHAKVCKDWEDKYPAGTPLDIVKDATDASGAKLGDLTVDPPVGCDGPLETS